MNNFSVFFKSGGGSTILIVDKYWQKVNRIFKEMSKNIYSTDIDNFHIELRVDGDFLSFGDPEGCNNLKLFKKKRLIANSISFGKDIYGSESLLSQFLMDNLVIAFEQIITRLEKDKLNVDGERLINDLKKLLIPNKQVE
jgi:hypothetical protein